MSGEYRWTLLWERYGVLLLLLALSVAFALKSSSFTSLANLRNLLGQTAAVAIAAAGMTLLITNGGFDLSIGSILSLVGVCLCSWIPEWGLGIALLLALLVGGSCGFFNGLLVTHLKLPTFIATLATMLLFRGIALLYSNGKDVNLFGLPAIKFFSSGEILQLPVPLFLLAGIYGLAYLVYRRLSLGLAIRAAGSNIQAAFSAGVSLTFVRLWVFTFLGLTTAVASLITTAQILVGNGKLGLGFELEVIAVTLLGGTALQGGRGNLSGTFWAALLLSVLKNGLNLFNVADYYQRLSLGLLLILALSIQRFFGQRGA